MILTGRPISKKRSYRRAKNGRMFLDAKYKTWQQDALFQLKKYKEKHTGLLMVDYTFEIKGKSVMDLDNAIVGINDILQDAGIIENDRHIVNITARKLYGFKDFRTQVTINTITEEIK